MAGYANPDALVETDWLEEHVNDPNIRVIEVDEDTEAYEKGHIQGAVGWNWTTDLHTEVGRDYVDQTGLSELLSGAGVGPETTVILYGGNNNWFAAYAYWVLKLRGFDDVKLLNGGRNADPFVIAKAAVESATVVTMELLKPNGTKIPNICDHFKVPCLSLEEFMEAEGWTF